MSCAWLRRIIPRILVFVVTGLISVIIFQTKIRNADPTPLKVIPDTTPAPVKAVTARPEVFFGYEGVNKMFLHGYEVRKVEAKVPYELPDKDGKLKPSLIDSTYVVLKKDGKTIAKFDGIESPLGNLAEFGLLDLLGDKSKQLIISLTISRGGAHWVISLDPEFRVLFGDEDYNVGREDFSIIDIDKDGVHELCLPVVSFYGMEGLQSVGETPLPEIFFKYDAKQMKFLPANHLFADYALGYLNPETERESYQHHRFDVLLDYIYAGKEEEGWASFDKHYPSPDKEVMKSRVKAILKDDAVYKYIYKNRKR